jgi:hypothetical protein
LCVGNRPHGPQSVLRVGQRSDQSSCFRRQPIAHHVYQTAIVVAAQRRQQLVEPFVLTRFVIAPSPSPGQVERRVGRGT